MLRLNTCLFSRVCSVYLQVADVKIKHLLFSRVCFVYLQVADVKIKHLFVFKSVFCLPSSS